jgi:hypothetical protein
VSGDSLWIVLAPGQQAKLRTLAYRMALARMFHLGKPVDVKQLAAAEVEHLKDCAWILFLAKVLFPPLSLISELGIEWHAQFIQAGRIITGDGNAVHFGFSFSQAQTVSFATNQFDIDYLTSGPANVDAHFSWVERLSALHEADELERWLDQLGIEEDWLRLALNIAPAALTCVLFTRLLEDLRNEHSKHAKPDVGYLAHTQEHLDELRGEGGVIERILAKLHGSTGLLRAHYEDTSEGGRNLSLCACSAPARSSRH